MQIVNHFSPEGPESSCSDRCWEAAPRFAPASLPSTVPATHATYPCDFPIEIATYLPSRFKCLAVSLPEIEPNCLRMKLLSSHHKTCLQRGLNFAVAQTSPRNVTIQMWEIKQQAAKVPSTPQKINQKYHKSKSITILSFQDTQVTSTLPLQRDYK